MSRPVYAPKHTYLGAGNKLDYTFNFKIEANTQLLVIEVDDNGDETQRVLGNDTVYIDTVVFDAIEGGGTVNLQAFLPNNYNIIILLANDAPTQPFEFRNKTSFTLKQFENALDFLAGAVQRLTYRGEQAFRIHDLDDESTFNSQFPPGVELALNRVLQINAAGTGVIYGPTADEVAGAQGFAIAAAISAAAALVSENNAALSEGAALVSENAAAVSEINAGLSEIAAGDSETAAALSETNASDSEIAAALSEGAALVSENAAAVSETNAGNSETAAAASAAAALISENNAAASALATGWTKVTKGFADLSAAALTNIIEAIELSAKDTVTGVLIKHTTAFLGGAITELYLEVGVNGEEDRFVSNFDGFQAVAELARQESNVLFIGNIGAITSLKLQAIAVGANLDQLTQGSVDIYFLVRALP